MNDKSLEEVVRQLEGESAQNRQLEVAVATESTDAQSSLLDGLRATEWLLSDLRERCRQLHGYRLQLIDRLCEFAGADDDDCLAGVVPGPIAVQ